MKPRSRVEKEFVERANSLPPYTQWRELLEWAKSEVFWPEAYYWKHRGNNQEIWCQCCGHREPCEDSLFVMQMAGYTCPKCGKKMMKVEPYDRKNPNTNLSRYVTVFDVVDKIQVLRVFEVFRLNSHREVTEYDITEIYQCWITDKGREVITTRRYTRSAFHFGWDYEAKYSIGRHCAGGSGYYYFNDVYCPGENYIYPKMKFSKAMRTMGSNKKFVLSMINHKVEISTVFSYLIREPYVESLLKTGYEKLYWHFLKSRKRFSKYRHAVNICHRNKYPVDLPTEWCDYIDELTELGLDTHNAHYVCPDDLRAAHETMSKRIIRKREKERDEQKLKQAVQDEIAFVERRQPFFDLQYAGDGFTVVCIKSVKEMMIEGQLLRHCVFSCGYYNKQDSLILSARDNETGKPIETIEVSLRDFSILQCRGNCNHDSDKHSEIVSLVQNNMSMIKNITERRIG